jgi:hypothetical protein
VNQCIECWLQVWSKWMVSLQFNMIDDWYTVCDIIVSHQCVNRMKVCVVIKWMMLIEQIERMNWIEERIDWLGSNHEKCDCCVWSTTTCLQIWYCYCLYCLKCAQFCSQCEATIFSLIWRKIFIVDWNLISKIQRQCPSNNQLSTSQEKDWNLWAIHTNWKKKDVLKLLRHIPHHTTHGWLRSQILRRVRKIRRL